MTVRVAVLIRLLLLHESRGERRQISTATRTVI